MKVLVCGTGAMGSLFSGLLSAAGADVNVLGTWNAALEAISTHGVNITRDSESIIQTAPLKTFQRLDANAAFELVIVLVKTYQTANLLPRLKGLLPHVPIITFQNGFGNGDAISTAVANPVWVGATNLGATLLEPGSVRWVGDGGTIMPDQPVLRNLFDSDLPFSIKTNFVADTKQAVWNKLVINAAINPITAIYGVRNGILLLPGEPRDRMLAITAECEKVGSRLGMNGTLEEHLTMIDKVLTATSENRSSMLSDVTRGSVTEIDSINGAVIKAARSLGIPTPENEKVFLEIKTSTAV